MTDEAGARLEEVRQEHYWTGEGRSKLRRRDRVDTGDWSDVEV